MSDVKLNIRLIKDAIIKAIQANEKLLVQKTLEGCCVVTLQEIAKTVKDLEEQLSILEELPCSGTVSYEPF